MMQKELLLTDEQVEKLKAYVLKEPKRSKS